MDDNEQHYNCFSPGCVSKLARKALITGRGFCADCIDAKRLAREKERDESFEVYRAGHAGRAVDLDEAKRTWDAAWGGALDWKVD